MGIFSGLLSLVAAIAAACGEEVVYWVDPVLGWRGALLSVAFFPVFTLIFTFVAAWALFLHRRILPGIWRGLSFWKRRP